LFGYAGAAWATLACYASMALASYLLGRKFYPVPYDVKRVLGYVVFAVALYVANQELIWFTGMHVLVSGTLFLLMYLFAAYAIDGRKLLQRT